MSLTAMTLQQALFPIRFRFLTRTRKSVDDTSDDPTDTTSDENDPTVIPMGSDPSLK